MSTGNHYSKQVAALEHVLRGKLSQLSVLSEENQALRQRERTLQAFQASLAGGLHATQKVLREASFGSHPVQGSVSDTMSGEDGSTTTSCSEGAAGGLSFTNGPALLQRLDGREEAVQQALQAIGGCDEAAYDELYTTQLLRRATSQPERTASILSMSISQRLAYVTKCVERFALLLVKYDRTGASTRSGPAKGKTDRLVDELSEKALTFGLLDPPAVHLSECMINMETSQPEAYPEGWWDLVVEAMELTEEQYAALKICYDKVKPVKDALTAQHSALSARLAQLQSSQHSRQRAFEQGAQEVYSWVHASQNEAHAADTLTAAAAGMTPQTALLARQAQRAKELREQQQQLSSREAAATAQGLLQLGSVALQAKIAAVEDADQLARLSAEGLQEAGQPSVAIEGGLAASAVGCPSPTCGPGNRPTTAFAAPWPQAAAVSLQQQQQQQRQVHFVTAPVQQQQQQQSPLSPQLQTGADAAEQLRQSFLQQDAAAAAAPGCVSLPELTVKVDAAAYQSAIVDEDLDLENLMEQGLHSSTASAAAGGLDGSGPQDFGNRSPAGGSGSSDNMQLLVSSAGRANNSGAAAPAAAAASGEILHPLSRDEVAAAVQGAVQDGFSSNRCGQGLNSVIARSSSQCQRDLLMHADSKEQQQIEHEMGRITSQLKMQQYWLALHMHNVCSKKQIALHYLHCFPFIPEAFSFFEALEPIWAGQACKNSKPKRSR